MAEHDVRVITGGQRPGTKVAICGCGRSGTAQWTSDEAVAALRKEHPESSP